MTDNFNIWNQLLLFQGIGTTTTGATAPYTIQQIPQQMTYLPRPDYWEETQRALAERQLKERRWQNTIEMLIGQEAERMAKALLVSCLTSKQREEFERSGGREITTKGNITGRTYKIYYGDRVWCWSRRTWYCIVPHFSFEERVPASDVMLAKKLMIEGDEQHFLNTAIGSYGTAR